MRFRNFLRILMPLSDNDRYCLEQLKDFEEFDEINRLVRQRKAKFELRNFNISIFEDGDYFQLTSEDSDLDVALLEKANKILKEKGEEEIFKRFSKEAFEILPEYMASNVLGLDIVKKAIVLQLFASDDIHILLLGNPGTGKTDLIKAASELYPKSIFGTGSGTKEAGLSVVIKNNDILKGLLPLANNGLCAIGDLNLMKREEKPNLYSAMDRGSVSYVLDGKTNEIEAKIKILATANPAGGKFDRTLDRIKRQLPFDESLLQRFHLLFFIKEPDVVGLRKVTKSPIDEKKLKLKEADIAFVKDYIKYCEKIEVNLPKDFENEITNFVADIKRKEFKCLIEVSPRVVIGLIRCCKALARLELREQVEKQDLERVKEIFKESLKV